MLLVQSGKPQGSGGRAPRSRARWWAQATFVQQLKRQNIPRVRNFLSHRTQGVTRFWGVTRAQNSVTIRATRGTGRGTLSPQANPPIYDSRLRGNDMFTIMRNEPNPARPATRPRLRRAQCVKRTQFRRQWPENTVMRASAPNKANWARRQVGTRASGPVAWPSRESIVQNKANFSEALNDDKGRGEREL